MCGWGEIRIREVSDSAGANERSGRGVIRVYSGVSGSSDDNIFLCAYFGPLLFQHNAAGHTRVRIRIHEVYEDFGGGVARGGQRGFRWNRIESRGPAVSEQNDAIGIR